MSSELVLDSKALLESLKNQKHTKELHEIEISDESVCMINYE